MSYNALSSYKNFVAPLTANATTTTLTISTSDAAVLKSYCDNYTEPTLIVANEAPVGSGTTYYEEFQVSSIDTSSGIITTSSGLSGYNYYVAASGAKVYINRIADGDQEQYNHKYGEVVGNALSLDGSTQYAQRPSSDDALNMGKDDFVAFVVFKYNPLQTDNNYPLFRNDYIGNYGYAIMVQDISGVKCLSWTLRDGTADYGRMSFDYPNVVNNIFFVFDRDHYVYYFRDGKYYIRDDISSKQNSIDSQYPFRIGYANGDYYDGDIYNLSIFRFGQSGLYVTGTGGTDLEIRVGSSTGDIIYSEVSPYSPSHPGGMIPAMYRNPKASLSELGYGSLENAERSELVTNGDFETYTGTQDDGTTDSYSGWLVYDIEGTIEATATVHSGNNALKLTRTSGTIKSNVKVTQDITVEGNKDYILSFYTRGDGTDDGTYSIYNVTTGGYISNYIHTGVSDTTYTEVIYVFTTPPNTTSIRIQLAANDNTDLATIYYDDVSIKRIGEVAHWKMDESGTPATLADTTSNNLDLTTVGSPPMVTAALDNWRESDSLVFKDWSNKKQGTRSLAVHITASGGYGEYIYHAKQNVDNVLSFWYKTQFGSANIDIDDTYGDIFMASSGVSQSDWKHEKMVVSCSGDKPAISARFSGTSSGTEVLIDDMSVVHSLVQNGSFELGTTNWTAYGSPTYATTTDVHAGETALKLTSSSSSNYVYQTVSVTSGDYYNIGAFMKVASGYTGYMALSGAASHAESTTSTDYDEIAYTFKAQTSSITIKFYGTGDTYVDDVYAVPVREISPATEHASTSAESFVTGKWGTSSGAFVIDGSDTLHWRAEGNIRADIGTFGAYISPKVGYNKYTEDKYLLDIPNVIKIYYNHTDYKFHFKMYDGSSWYDLASAAQTFSYGDWVHVAATWDNTSALKLYINKTLVDSTVAAWTTQSLPSYMYIGCNSSGSGQLDMPLDDVFIYLNALSATELASLVD